MAVALLAVLLTQIADPQIESVERLAGNLRRPNQSYLWAPLAVTLRSERGYEGELEVASSLGIRVVRQVRVPARGRVRVQVPGLDPQKVTVGGSTFPLPPATRSAERVVLVDQRLPFASELLSDDRVLIQPVGLEDLTWLLSQGLMDGCDLLLLKDVSGLSLGSVRSWSMPSSREDAEKKIAAPIPSGDPVLLVDPDLWTLAPESGWVPAKKDWTLIFSALYAFATFAALVFASRKGDRAMAGMILAVASLGIVAFLGLFPRRHLWVVEHVCEIVKPSGEAQEVRVWFSGAAAALHPSLDFPRVVKPVYPRLGEAEEPVTLRIGEGGGCRVEGFSLPAGRSLCFSAVLGRAPTTRVTDRVERPLFRAFVRRDGKVSAIGDLAVGAAVPRGGPEGPAGEDPEARLWFRFVEGDALLGRLEERAGPATGVGSPDLAEGRKAPALFLERLP